MTKRFSPVLDVAVFLIVVLHSSVDCKVHKLGCDFENEDYFLGERKLTTKWGKNPTEIVFNTEDRFKSFLHEVTRIYNEVLTSNKFNTIDSFIKFYDDSKPSIDTNVETILDFYVRYNYKFQPRTNGLSLAIEILNQISNMKDKFPEVENKGYLSSSPEGFSEPEIKRYTSLKDGTNFLKKVHGFKIINAVATLKIKLNSNLVYVILNANQYFDKPIVLVDGQLEHPLNNKIVHSRGIKYSFDFFHPHKGFVIGTSYDKKNNTLIAAHELVYIGESYCSVMETTDKRTLVVPRKALLKRKNGNVVAGFEVNFEKKEQTPVLETFLELNGNTVKKRVTFPVHSEGAFDKELNTEEKEHLNVLADALGFKKEELVAKLTTLNKILSDETFRETVVDFNAILGADLGKEIEDLVNDGAKKH